MHDIDRRAVWTLPVVVAAIAAPAVAASPATMVALKGQCKLPGQSTPTSWGYRLTLEIRSLVATTLTFVSVQTPDGELAKIVKPTEPIQVFPGRQTVIVIVSGTNSAQGTAS